MNKINKRQKREILIYVKEMSKKIDHINTTVVGDDDSIVEERNNKIDNVIKYYNYYMRKKTVKKDVMYKILTQIHQVKYRVNLLNILYNTQKDTFLKAFKLK